MKKYLMDLIAKKKDKLAKLLERSNASTDVNEVRSINEEMTELRSEIAGLESQVANIRDEEHTHDKGEEQRGALNPVANFNQGDNQSHSEERDNDPRGTMEYRTAFMNYVRTGAVSNILEHRQNDQNESGDLGVLLPSTVVQDIIKGVEKVYGQLYSRVKKTNIKGGVKYPIGSFGATFKRITDSEPLPANVPSDRQNGGQITGYVEFSYKLGEIRLAQTLLASVLSVPVFEAELSKVIVEAYVKAMDYEILKGNGESQELEGILTEANKISGSRIPASNIIEFTANEMADWTAWQKKLFAIIPLSMRSLRPEFVMTPHTYEANIKTLKDNNNRPLYNETFNPVDGAETATFKGRPICFVEEGQGIVNFDDGVNGDYFGIYWIPEKAYAINTNLEFAVTRYFDNEKLQYVDRAVVINDGKILDPKYLYLLKKKVTG